MWPQLPQPSVTPRPPHLYQPAHAHTALREAAQGRSREEHAPAGCPASSRGRAARGRGEREACFCHWWRRGHAEAHVSGRLKGPPAAAGARRRRQGRGVGGGGEGVKAEEGVPANRPHRPGAVPCSWRRVGPPGGPLCSPVRGGCGREAIRVGGTQPRPLPLKVCGFLGPGKPGRGSGPCYTTTLRLAKISPLRLLCVHCGL